MSTEFLATAINISTLLRVALFLTVGLVAHRMIHRFIGRLDRVLAQGGESAVAYQERVATLTGVIHNAISVVVWGSVVYLILSELRINVAPLVASAGIVGFAVGFGSQQLVRDLIGGFFILLENQFNKGDLVEIAGKTGVVREIRLRTTILKDENGSICVIPNSEIGIVTRLK